jgi:hypothetical protein
MLNVKPHHQPGGVPTAGDEINQPSFEQSRGMMFLLAAYPAETSLTIGSVTASSATYQSEITFHALPSHCWMRAVLAPS